MTIKVYVDVLFIINFIADYILLCVTSLFIKRRASILRLCLAGALGGVFSVFSFFATFNPFITAMFSVAVSCLMIWICYGARKIFTLFKNTSVFYLISLCTAGLGFSAMCIGRNSNFLIGSGFLYTDINAYTLLFVFIVSVILVHSSVGFIKKQGLKSRYLYSVTIEKNGKSVTDTALFDTGNFLRDPISQKSVVIAEWKAVSKLFEQKTLSECITNNPDTFVYVPCRILNGNTGLYAFSPDKILTHQKSVTEPFLVAVSETPLDKNESFKIILPNDFYSTERM